MALISWPNHAFAVLLTAAILLSVVLMTTTMALFPKNKHNLRTSSRYSHLRGSYFKLKIGLRSGGERRHSAHQPGHVYSVDARTTTGLFKTQERIIEAAAVKLKGKPKEIGLAPASAARGNSSATPDAIRVVKKRARPSQSSRQQQQQQQQQQRRAILSLGSRSDSSLCPPGLPLCQAAAVRQREARERSKPAPDQKEVRGTALIF